VEALERGFRKKVLKDLRLGLRIYFIASSVCTVRSVRRMTMSVRVELYAHVALRPPFVWSDPCEKCL
jgi:hypothetical protein